MVDRGSTPAPALGSVKRIWHRAAKRFPRAAKWIRGSVGMASEYARLPFAHWQTPNPLFDADWYLTTNPDVKAQGIDPYRHFRLHGVWEGRDPNEVFDTSWYMLTYSDVRASGRNPVDHFLTHGWKEGRDPSPVFSTMWYLRQYPDVREAGINPLLDYLRTGKAKGRQMAPPHRSRKTRSGDAVPASNARDPPAPSDPARLASTAVSNSTSAIAHLESLRAEGVTFIEAPPALDMLAGLAGHLARYPTLSGQGDGAAIHDVRTPREPAAGSLEDLLFRFTEAIALRTDRQPSILAWRVAADLLGHSYGHVFQPPPWVDSHLPYLDDSVDLVLVGDDRPPITDEAVRVARVAVLRVMGSAHDRSVRVAWQADNAAGGEARVSIVIPTLNRGNVLHACLRSLRETVPSGVPIEVIVVDDGSEQDDRADLETACRAFGVTLLRNERNTGFVASVNRGASAASGAYLLFLNDDTVLLPGWLPPLLRVFRARSDAGAVGGKLVYPDGRLMEAGGIVYSDGSGANYGKFDANPEAPLYCYLRDVDYVSGAMLMTPRALFEQLGGFDAVFGFGFYEDTDYCFRVREAGRRVYYQPASVIVHREGVSAGTDIRHGAKHFQARNRPIFVDRWRSQLGTQAAPP